MSQQKVEPIKYGDQEEIVKEIQNMLLSLGYENIKSNGIFGKNEVTAIKEFQRERGLKITGEVNKSTLDTLTKVFRTMWVQTTLKRFGYYNGDIDGVYNSDLEKALKDFGIKNPSANMTQNIIGPIKEEVDRRKNILGSIPTHNDPELFKFTYTSPDGTLYVSPSRENLKKSKKQV